MPFFCQDLCCCEYLSMGTHLSASRACETSRKLIKILRSARLRPRVGNIHKLKLKLKLQLKHSRSPLHLLATLPMQKRSSKRKLHFNCFRAEPLDLYVVTLLLINKICESSAQCDAVQWQYCAVHCNKVNGRV